jgi:hypothetical protein
VFENTLRESGTA